MPQRRGTTVAGVVLNIADDGAFEDPTERWDVADGERGTATAVVLVVKLGRDCNGISLWESPRVNSLLNLRVHQSFS